MLCTSWGAQTQPMSSTPPREVPSTARWVMGQEPAPPRRKLLWVTLHLLRTSINPFSEWEKHTPARSLAWSNEVFCFPEKGEGCAHDSPWESFWATQNSTANSCFQFIVSVSSWITNTATRTLQMPLTNKFPATEENNFKKINLKLCSPQTWYILPNSENTQSRRPHTYTASLVFKNNLCYWSQILWSGFISQGCLSCP